MAAAFPSTQQTRKSNRPRATIRCHVRAHAPSTHRYHSSEPCPRWQPSTRFHPSQPILARVAVPHSVLCLRAHPLSNMTRRRHKLLCTRGISLEAREAHKGDRFMFGNLVSPGTLTMHTCILPYPCWPIALWCLRHVTEQWDDLLLHLTRL